jgi:hypothetical protein
VLYVLRCIAACSYNILVVHAGLVPGLPLHQQNLTMLIKLRELLQAPDGRCGSEAVAGSLQYPEMYLQH